jgi:hypothetical protein
VKESSKKQKLKSEKTTRESQLGVGAGQEAGYVLNTLELLLVATLSDAHGLVEGLERPVVMQSVEAHPFVQHLRTIV